MVSRAPAPEQPIARRYVRMLFSTFPPFLTHSDNFLHLPLIRYQVESGSVEVVRCLGYSEMVLPVVAALVGIAVSLTRVCATR